MFNLLFCIVNYIFVDASVSPHLKMGVLDARDFIKKREISKENMETTVTFTRKNFPLL